MTRVDDAITSMNGAKYFSVLDLKAGYWQIEMIPDERPLTAFVTRDGHYEWVVMPFGLKGAPTSFCRLMTKVLTGLIWKNCVVHLDGILVYSKTIEEHLHRLDEVFRSITAT